VAVATLYLGLASPHPITSGSAFCVVGAVVPLPLRTSRPGHSRQDCPSARRNLKSGREVRVWGAYEERGGVRSKPFENPSIAVERWSRAEKKPTIHAVAAS
jgi:hypothetical protein